jgi:hypothetical protein
MTHPPGDAATAESELVGARGTVSRRRYLLEAVVATLLVLCVYGVLRPDPVKSLGTMYDDVVYVSLAKSIATGQGYHSIHLVGAPVHEKFPPGVPVVYALAWRITGSLHGTLWLGLWLTIGAVAAGAGLLVWYSRSSLGNGLVLTAVLVLMPVVLQRSMRYYAGAVSEPWYLLTWAGALILAGALQSHAGARPRRNNLAAIGLGLVLAASVLFRAQAIVLIPAILVALLVRRATWRATAITAAASLVPVLAWRVWLAREVAIGPRSTLTDQVPYTSWIPLGDPGAMAHFVKTTIVTNVPQYLALSGRVLVGWESRKAQLLFLAALVAAAFGCWLLRRRRPELVLTLVATMAVVLVWPFTQDRFIVAALPFAGLVAAFGMRSALDRAPTWAMRVSLTVAALAALYMWQSTPRKMLVALRDPVARDTLVIAPLFQQRSAEVVNWVLANTSPDDIILADAAGGFYLKTGRRTSIAIPEEPFTDRRAFVQPGRYVAERLLADSVSIVVLWRSFAPFFAQQLDIVEKRCPGTFTPLQPIMSTSEPLFVNYFRVQRNECLRGLVTDSGPFKETPTPTHGAYGTRQRSQSRVAPLAPFFSVSSVCGSRLHSADFWTVPTGSPSPPTEGHYLPPRGVPSPVRDRTWPRQCSEVAIAQCANRLTWIGRGTS